MTNRRTVLLILAMAAAVMAASGVALAATPINCVDDAVAPCDGTTGDDEMTGTSGTDHTYAKEGNDTLRSLKPSTISAVDRATTPSMEDGATTSTIFTSITGGWTASPPTVAEHRTG